MSTPDGDLQHLPLLRELRLLDSPPDDALLALLRLLQGRVGPAVKAGLALRDATSDATGSTPHWVFKPQLALGIDTLPASALPLGTSADAPASALQHFPRLDQALPGLTAPVALMAAPVVVDAHTLGWLCLLAPATHPFGDDAAPALQEAATVVSSLLQSQLHSQRARLQVARVRGASLSSSDWLWETDDQGLVTWVSSSIEHHTGLPRGTSLGLTLSQINRPCPDDPTDSFQRYRDARARLEPFRDVIAERDTPQGVLVVSMSGAPVFDSQGRFRGYRGATSNITARMEAQRAARKAERLLGDALDSLNAGVMITDPSGRVVLSNALWQKNLGRHIDETSTWPQVVERMVAAGEYPDATDPQAYVAWRLSLANDRGELHELRWRDRWVLVSDRRLADGSVVHLSVDITDRKRTELALTESQAALAAVLGAVPDRWFVLDAEGRFLECSGQDHPMLHKPWDALRGQPFSAAVPKALADRVVAAIAQALQTGQVQRLDYDLIAANDAARIFEARISPMPGQRVLYVTRDVTEQTRAADKLRLSEELYRSVAAAISDGLLVVTPTLAIIAVNPAGCAILGVEQPAVVGLNGNWPFELLDAEARTLPFVQHPVSRVVSSSKPVIGQVHLLRRPDGDTRWLLLNAHPLQLRPEGSTFSVVLTFRDVTQQRTAEQALVAAEERWKFALEGSGDGVWDWNVRDEKIFFSARWKEMLGYAENEVEDVAETWSSRIHPQDLPRVLAELRRHLRGETPLYESEHRVRHRDGRYLWMLDRGKIVSRGEDGRVDRIVGTQSDITRSKQAEQMQRDKQAAELASRAKSEFLSRMSHEMRTPLNAVIGFSQLLGLQRGPMDPDTVRSYADHMRVAGEHLLALIDDVLDLQKIEEGAFTLTIGPVDLRAEVARAFDFLGPTAREQQVQLDNRVQQPLWVRADAQRLRQVLLNVASNAIKYNHPGGMVRCRVDTPPPGPATPPLAHAAGRVVLSLEDNGAGMSAEQMSRLFQPFERLGRETSTIEGTGLGLIIARSLTQAIGGRLEVDSEPGRGTTVRLELQAEVPPQVDDERQVVFAAPKAEPSSAPGLRMLYVEDNRINAILFEEAMRLHGDQIELRVAEDGDQAMELAQHWRPEVLVLDAHLPGISGFEVLQRLRTLPGLDTVPAYMCSADAMPEDVKRAYEAGFIGYWTKPINVGSVMADIGQWVRRSRGGADLATGAHDIASVNARE